jgi:hypothetical protein
VGSLSTWFNFGSVISGQVTELENIFPLEMQKTDFIRIDATNIYSKILTDTFERTHGISNDTQPLLFDNCHMSDSKEGLITMLAKAMVDKKDLFIVYDRAVKIIRKATGEEQSKIRADYEAQGESGVGSFISFKNYDRSDMVLLFSALEYATTSALNKDINVSNAIQFKMKGPSWEHWTLRQGRGRGSSENHCEVSRRRQRCTTRRRRHDRNVEPRSHLSQRSHQFYKSKAVVLSWTS